MTSIRSLLSAALSRVIGMLTGIGCATRFKYLPPPVTPLCARSKSILKRPVASKARFPVAPFRAHERRAADRPSSRRNVKTVAPIEPNPRHTQGRLRRPASSISTRCTSGQAGFNARVMPAILYRSHGFVWSPLVRSCSDSRTTQPIHCRSK